MTTKPKSRYVPPHLRNNNKNIIIANPDDELGPIHKNNNNHFTHQQLNQMNNLSPQSIQTNRTNRNNNHSNSNTNNNSSPHSHSPRRSYRNDRILNDDWRKNVPTEQPQLDQNDLFTDKDDNNDEQQINIQENSTQNNSNNNRQYNQNRRYESRRRRHHYKQQCKHNSEDDPNELTFAKLNDENNKNNNKKNETKVTDKNKNINIENDPNNPYDKSPFDSRYNRQYSSKTRIYEHELNSNQLNEYQQYQLSENFKTLTTNSKNRQQRRRRRTDKNNNNNNVNIIINNNNSNNKQKQKKKIIREEDNNNSTHTIINSNKRLPPVNWAAKLKQDNNNNNNDNNNKNDSDKVRHVLEVLNMKYNDMQYVTGCLRHFNIQFNTLISVQKRWFVIFDYPQTAANALNIVKNNKFKLRRIDTNIDDVKMLKNNVPPPITK
eukprot:534039_1